jgi:DNA helicase HerA-like ATPase
VVKLIRSKGVGVYFVTQNPLDIPDAVLAQLGNRIQHALRAYTPREQKAVKAASSTFRPNPEFDAEDVIMQMGVGEALVSTLEDKGIPSIVQRTLIRPPSSRLGPITEDERAEVLRVSPVGHLYDEAVDRESAYEILSAKAEKAAAIEEKRLAEEAEEKERAAAEKAAKRSSGGRRRQTATEAAVKSLTRSVATSLGRALVRGILGSLRR